MKKRTPLEKKKITVGLIFSYLFGILFLFSGLGTIVSSPLIGLLITFISLLILPASSDWICGKMNFTLSGGVKFVLVIVILVLFSFAANQSQSEFESDVVIEQTPSNNPVISESEVLQKVKKGEFSLIKVYANTANLQPIRLKVVNTGDISFSPEFDVVVMDSNGGIVCEGSPYFSPFGSIHAGESETDELTIPGCMFENDGTYDVTVDMLDKDYNILNTQSTSIEVTYWGKFS